MKLRQSVARGLVLCLLVLVLPALDADACPFCKKSPNGWGFCRYYNHVGYDWCEGYVADEFSGRTWCHVEGYCNWDAPYLAKDDGTGEPAFGCGATELDPQQVWIY